jgi:hypothetical protein
MTVRDGAVRHGTDVKLQLKSLRKAVASRIFRNFGQDAVREKAKAWLAYNLTALENL